MFSSRNEKCIALFEQEKCRISSYEFSMFTIVQHNTVATRLHISDIFDSSHEYSLEPLYKKVHYKMVLNISLKVDPKSVDSKQKYIDYIKK